MIPNDDFGGVICLTWEDCAEILDEIGYEAKVDVIAGRCDGQYPIQKPTSSGTSNEDA